jgi:thiamine biosynthesis protein ThiI
VDKRAFVNAEKIPGPGGLPVGVSGRAVALLSGGIDSPVAAYKAMKRGLRVVFAHFHSYPYTSRASISKAVRLVELLSQHQVSSRLYLIPFSEIQQEIVGNAPPGLRVILYRRFMVRIAEAIAKREGAKALVTGESVGQVASQTIDNIATINAVSGLPVLRPVIGEDKKDIIRAAQEIGTYGISIEPHDDCCSLFLPKSPATHATAEQLARAEQALDTGRLVAAALEKAEVKVSGGKG